MYKIQVLTIKKINVKTTCTTIKDQNITNEHNRLELKGLLHGVFLLATSRLSTSKEANRVCL